MSITVRFAGNRIGRRTNVADLVTEKTNPTAILAEVERYASRFLGSRGIDADYWPDSGRGFVMVGGFRTVAEFTVEPLSEVTS